MIELRALGALALRDSTGEDLHSVLAQPKRVALLAYLAIARPRGFHRRDTLLALLWPEQDEQHARWALNQALRHLRTALGKEAVPSRGDGEIGIDVRALSCDAVEFEAAIEADDSARALGLYRGDLLDGFHVSGCGEFERWLEEERVWLRRRAARAAAALAHREEARGEPVAAGHWARRALALAPDDEAEARNLIELLGRLGDRAGAVQAYEDFARRLRHEYEVDPAPETLATITAVRTRQLATTPSPAAAVDQPAGDIGPVAPEPTVRAPPTRAPARHPRPGLRELGLLVLGAAGTMIWALRPAPPVAQLATVSPTTIAVLPFAYQGTQEFAYLGEGMMDLLSANLDGAGEVRTADPDAVLALFRQAGGDRLEPEQARNLAARLGAGSYVLGNIVETGGHLRISARLHSGDQKDGRGQALVDGQSPQLFQLVDRLTTQLIAQRSGGPAGALPRLAALTTDSLAALKAYLEAERHFRAWRLDSSIQAAERAVRIDSSFALAYYRLATALLWTDGRNAGEAVDRSLRHGRDLSHRDRRLIEALAAFLHGRIREAGSIYREIVTRNPNDLEATFQLADLIHSWSGHLGSSWLDARELFERLLSIDPGHHDAYFHLSLISARERRLEQLDSLTDRLLADRRLRKFPPPGSSFYRGQRAVAFGDTAEIARFMAALRKSDDDVAQWTGGAVVFTTGDLVVGRRIWRLFTEPSRSRGLRVLAHLTLAKMELMTGRWSAAKVEIDSAMALDSVTALEHRALLSLWPLLQVSQVELLALRNSLQRWKAAAGPPNEGFVTAEHAPAHPYLRLYLLGLLSVRLEDHAPALEYAAELDRQAGASFAPAFVRGLGRGVRVEVARARGQADLALATLDSAASGAWGELGWLEITGNSPFYFQEYQQFVRAELLNTLGRDAEALEAYRGIADYLFHSGGPAHLRLAEIYERRREPQKAATHYARFAELWKDCDPEFRPLVEEVRRRMAKRNGA
jgi:DNA-binding SARP family transcriptional activator/TolB-like protein